MRGWASLADCIQSLQAPSLDAEAHESPAFASVSASEQGAGETETER